MTIAVTMSIFLVLATSGLHYFTLQLLSSGRVIVAMRPAPRVLCIVLVLLAAHLAGIVIYAAAYLVAATVLELGHFGGIPVENALDFLYFSVVTYTSLGIGDVFPNGHLRFLAGIEALNGLLLITWSASFIFLAMGRLWPWQAYPGPTQKDGA